MMVCRWRGESCFRLLLLPFVPARLSTSVMIPCRGTMRHLFAGTCRRWLLLSEPAAASAAAGSAAVVARPGLSGSLKPAMLSRPPCRPSTLLLLRDAVGSGIAQLPLATRVLFAVCGDLVACSRDAAAVALGKRAVASLSVPAKHR